MSINPYAAPPPKPVYTLPATRLRRLGATPATMAALESWFGHLDGRTRQSEAERLATAFDPELAQWVEGINDLGQAPVHTVVAWVEHDGYPSRAAAVALELEKARPRPRSTLVEKLASLGGTA